MALRVQRGQLPRAADRRRRQGTRGKIVARLDWEEQAETVRRSIEAGKKKRRAPTRDQLAYLAAEPILDAGTGVLALAYADISVSRTSAGAIPYSEMLLWAVYHGLEPHVTRHAMTVWRRVDAARRQRDIAAREAERAAARKAAEGRTKKGRR